MRGRYATKEDARQAVWDALATQRAARFPFPPHGRIPNFVGAKQAAQRLPAHALFRGVRSIKVNPDAPQRYVRHLALMRGIVVVMPTPRLRHGFRRFDPARIPAERLGEAAALARGARWSEGVPVKRLPAVDLVVTGCAAVTLAGKRCDKGHGYGDIEYAILRELGHSPVTVATTVHPLQIVDDFPADPHELPVSLIATPEQIFDVPCPPAPPVGIDWALVDDGDLAAMPVLRELQALRKVR